MGSSISSRLRRLERSSDRSSYDYDKEPEWGPQYLDYLIFRLFLIDISNLVQVKATLLKQFHIVPDAVNNMPYWEYEMLMKYLNDQVKDENDRQEAEMSKYDVQGTMKAARHPDKMISNATPKMPSINMPSSIHL